MKLPTRFFLTTFLVTLTAMAAHAGSAAGVWKWTFTTRSGDTIESTMTLTQEGEKLTGMVNSRFGKNEISEGELKDEQLSFKVKPEINGQEVVIKFSGKVQGDKIIGKTEFQRDGQVREREWEAKREPNKTSAGGAWKTALILPDGNRIEGTIKLKQEGNKLTGAVIRNENETAIQDGKVAGDEVSFKVIREREGRTVTATYKGKISGDAIKGKVESDWSGDWQTLDWEGSRAK